MTKSKKIPQDKQATKSTAIKSTKVSMKVTDSPLILLKNTMFNKSSFLHFTFRVYDNKTLLLI